MTGFDIKKYGFSNLVSMTFFDRELLHMHQIIED